MRRWLGIALMVGCAEEPATCEGGGEPTLEIGGGGRDAFVPFSDGDAVPLSGGAAQLDLWTAGLDTTSQVTGVVRIDAGGGSQDSIAGLTLLCGEPGYGWVRVLAALPAGATSGTQLDVSATLTDATGTAANATFTGPIE